ncbi:MAG: type II toxin-antitoxin system VapC family toxin [Clostridiales bacterium]|nr:type II toxin-antitoxin system VapC family toxin [Clostridiales bacterium]
MSIQVVVDSCVAYKWFYKEDEAGLEEAEDLLQSHLDGTRIVSAPTVLPVEIANTLLSSGLPLEQTDEILDLLESARLHLYYTGTRQLQRASALARKHRLAVYDALFLALAEELSCPLVTADCKAFAGIDTPVEIRLI